MRTQYIPFTPDKDPHVSVILYKWMGGLGPLRTQVWVRSIREVTRLFNEAGLTISASTVYAIQSQRDDRDMGRPNTRKIRPLPAWANFEAVGMRGERERQE